ncbi:MAG: WYL domain-containing protein, partial [Micromonosporaceae bacterium]
AGAYLRSDDEARLAELYADKRLTHLGLRRLAPTVLVTPYAPARLLTQLREHGYAPVPEDTAGTVVLTRPDVRRAPGRPRTPAPADELILDQPRALAAVAAIRRGDAAARAARRTPVLTRPAGSVTETLAVLQQALRAGREVWVGYVDSHGSDASRLVRPVSMGSGYLRAEDGRTDMIHTFALHRITSATLAE